MTKAEQKIKELKELRRQAGYEPSSWYEQKEEEVLLQAFKEIELETTQAINEKLAMFPYCTFGCKSCENLKGETHE